jgi:hypothetical protein
VEPNHQIRSSDIRPLGLSAPNSSSDRDVSVQLEAEATPVSMSSKVLDSSSLEGEGGLECASYDGNPSDGEFHTRNFTPDEVQRNTITDRGTDSYFKSSVRIITCIHGHMKVVDNQPSDPATLLVLEYKLHPKPGHKFDSVYTSFTFKESPANTGEPAKPEVIAYAPFRRPRRWDKTDASVTTNHAFGGKLGVSEGVPVSTELSTDHSKEETHLQQYFAEGSADIHYNDRTGLDDSVWWSLEHNKSQKLGVLSVFRVAMLIKRQSMSDFIGTFKMEIHGSFKYLMGQVGGQISRFLRHIPLDDPVNFSPTKKPRQGKLLCDDCSNSLGDLVIDIGDGDGLYLPDDYHLESFLPS